MRLFTLTFLILATYGVCTYTCFDAEYRFHGNRKALINDWINGMASMYIFGRMMALEGDHELSFRDYELCPALPLQ